jgi:hypothetical protein
VSVDYSQQAAAGKDTERVCGRLRAGRRQGYLGQRRPAAASAAAWSEPHGEIGILIVLIYKYISRVLLQGSKAPAHASMHGPCARSSESESAPPRNSRGAAAMDALQAYLFDLNGFIHIPSVLEPSAVATLLEVSRNPPPQPDWQAGDGRGAKLRAANETLHWHRAFRDLVAHSVVAPILEELCGKGFRLCVCGSCAAASLATHRAIGLTVTLYTLC